MTCKSIKKNKITTYKKKIKHQIHNSNRASKISKLAWHHAGIRRTRKVWKVCGTKQPHKRP
jgi:hypothetical protein